MLRISGSSTKPCKEGNAGAKYQYIFKQSSAPIPEIRSNTSTYNTDFVQYSRTRDFESRFDLVSCVVVLPLLGSVLDAGQKGEAFPVG